LVGGLLYKLPLLLLGGVGARSLAGGLGTGTAFRIALVGLFVGYQALLTAADRSPWYGEHFSADYRRHRFVASYVETRSARSPATVYWPTDVRDVWFDVRANSYFNVVQLNGCVFNPGTAVEGRRRAELVRKFECEALRAAPAVPSFWHTALCRYFQINDDDTTPPTAADLVRLCGDPLLDVVVIPQEFDGLWCATDGKYYLYDCEQVRGLARSE